jgi:hypothetical protein
MVGSTLGVYRFGVIFVSARTNKRHHHASFLLCADPGPATPPTTLHAVLLSPHAAVLDPIYFLFVQEQIKEIIIIPGSLRTSAW